MKIAAALALANLAWLNVPEEVIKATNRNLNFGKEYIVPSPFDPWLISVVSLEVAKAACNSNQAWFCYENWSDY